MPTHDSPTVFADILIGYNENVGTYLVDGSNYGFRIGCYGYQAT